MTKLCVDLKNQLSKLRIKYNNEKAKWVEEKRELMTALENERSKKTDLLD